MIINHCHYMGGIYYNLKLPIQMMLKNSPLDESPVPVPSGRIGFFMWMNKT